MSDAAEKLKPLLAALYRHERAEVTAYLCELDNRPLDEDGEEVLTPEEWEAVWVAECERRIADAEAGRTVAIPHEEVMRRMKEKYG